MGKPLRVLVVEGSEEASLLVIHHLQRGGYDPSWERVETPAELDVFLSRAPTGGEWVVKAEHGHAGQGVRAKTGGPVRSRAPRSRYRANT